LTGECQQTSIEHWPMNANNVNFLATNLTQSVLNPGYDAATDNGNETQYNDDIYVTNRFCGKSL
jgi:hypothetical protein